MQTVPQKSPQFERAEKHLRSIAADIDCQENGDRLPTLTALAAQASVSRKIMHRAVRALCKEGLLQARTRDGIRLRGGRNKQSDNQSGNADEKWRRIAQALNHDIVSGEFRNASGLPLRKELQNRYGVNYRTMRKALHCLAEKGIIAAKRTGFAIVRAGAARSSSAYMILYTNGRMMDVIHAGFFMSRFSDFTFALERVCSQRNIRVHKRLYEDHVRHPDERGGCYGAILWVTWGDHPSAIGLAQQLSHANIPVVAIDAIADPPDVFGPLRIPSFSVYRIAEWEAGARVGRFLLGMGHTKVAFFSHHRAHGPWAEKRCGGVKAAFRDAGLPDDSVRFFLSVARQADLNPAPVRLGAHWPDDPHFQASIRARFADQAYFREMREEMPSCFEKALAIPGIAAWVAESDTLAVEAALPFLRKKKKRIPGDIALVGFENTVLATVNSLTTYDYGFHLCPYDAVDRIVNWAGQRRLRRAAQGSPVYEIAGSVIRRETA